LDSENSVDQNRYGSLDLERSSGGGYVGELESQRDEYDTSTFIEVGKEIQQS
jgi:hypothetical protein